MPKKVNTQIKCFLVFVKVVRETGLAMCRIASRDCLGRHSRLVRCRFLRTNQIVVMWEFCSQNSPIMQFDTTPTPSHVQPLWGQYDHMITTTLLTLSLTRTDYPTSWVSMETGTCERTSAVVTQSVWVAVVSPILTFVNIWEYTITYWGKLYEHNMKWVQKLGKYSSRLFVGAVLHVCLDISLQKGKHGVLWGGKI